MSFQSVQLQKQAWQVSRVPRAQRKVAAHQLAQALVAMLSSAAIGGSSGGCGGGK